jgi:hypothetical protein
LSARFFSGLVLVFTLVSGCRRDPAHQNLTIVVPEVGARPREFEIVSSFAEYVELPELRRELRLTFATYPLACDAYRPPPPEELAVLVTVVAPPAEPIAVGTVSFGTPDIADGGVPVVSRRNLSAVIRKSERAFTLEPGGLLELSHVELAPGGRASGLLALEFPGDARTPASTVRGRFDARLCQPR